MTELTGRLERIVNGFEVVAGVFIALVTALTFAAVVLRFVFSWGLPDAFDIGRNLLGITIFWGITLAGYRGDHITVDLLWGALKPRARRVMDLFATVVTVVCMSVFVWMMGGKVLSTRSDHLLTFDLHLPVWIFFLVAWLGLAASVPLLLLRLYRVLVAPLEQGPAAPTVSH